MVLSSHTNVFRFLPGMQTAARRRLRGALDSLLAGETFVTPGDKLKFLHSLKAPRGSCLFHGMSSCLEQSSTDLDHDPQQRSEVFSGWKHKLNPPRRKKPPKSTFGLCGAPLWTSVRNVGSCPQILDVHLRWFGLCKGHDLRVFSAHRCVSVFSAGWG